jgi:hypothetical protein
MRAELQQRLAWLGQVQEHIKATLDYEIQDAEGIQSLLFMEGADEVERGSPIATFLREVLSDFRPRSLDELKVMAGSRGIDFKDKNPGRVLHFALVGLAQNKMVESLGNGVWRLYRGVAENESGSPTENIQGKDAPIM